MEQADQSHSSDVVDDRLPTAVLDSASRQARQPAERDERAESSPGAADAAEVNEIDYASIPFDFVDSLPHGGKPGKPGRQFRKRWKRRRADGEFIRLSNGRIAIRTKTYKWVSHQTWKTLKRYAKQPEVICEKIEQWEKIREGKRDY